MVVFPSVPEETPTNTVVNVVQPLVASPLGGALAGTAPQLTCTPAESFTGLDTFTFQVGNGVSMSRAATVEVTVVPSSADTTPPEVAWTYPVQGARLSEVAVLPTLVDSEGPIYAPSLLV